MDLLRRLAKGRFDPPGEEVNDEGINAPNDDGQPALLFKALQLVTSAGDTASQHLELPSHELAHFLKHGHGDTKSDGHSIKIVFVNAEWDLVIPAVGQALFLQLVAAAGFDMSLTPRFWGSAFCYLHHGSFTDPNGMSFCFRSNVRFSAFWTIRQVGTDFETRCVMFLWRETGLHDLTEAFCQCKIESYSPLAVPLVLVCVLLSLEWVEKSFYIEIIGGTEDVVGVWRGEHFEVPKRINIDRILELNSRIGNCIVRIETSQIQLRENIRSMLLHLEELSRGNMQTMLPHLEELFSQGSGNEKNLKIDYFRRAVKGILDAIMVVKEDHKGLMATIENLYNRAKLQKDMLFNFMTHEDSYTNMDVAHASRQLAEEARRDGSSMKTITVLTMVFLPGTFFATLFSLPSFDDGASDQVTRLYWALTVPVTAAVFVLWATITQRKEIRALSRNIRDSVVQRQTTRSSTGSHSESYRSSFTNTAGTQGGEDASVMSPDTNAVSESPASMSRKHEGMLRRIKPFGLKNRPRSRDICNV